MQAQELCAILGIDQERLKYYTKNAKVFIPENQAVNGRIDYTENDMEKLKKIVLLNKAGLSCGEIKAIQEGKTDLSTTLIEKRKKNIEEMERLRNSNQLAMELLNKSVAYESLETDHYWNKVDEMEQAGFEFEDAYYQELSNRVFLHEIECPYCGEAQDIDLEDYLLGTSSYEKEHGMGPDVVYEFDSEDNCKCQFCEKVISITGWVREYPTGAWDSEDITVQECD